MPKYSTVEEMLLLRVKELEAQLSTREMNDRLEAEKREGLVEVSEEAIDTLHELVWSPDARVRGGTETVDAACRQLTLGRDMHRKLQQQLDAANAQTARMEALNSDMAETLLRRSETIDTLMYNYGLLQEGLAKAEFERDAMSKKLDEAKAIGVKS